MKQFALAAATLLVGLSVTTVPTSAGMMRPVSAPAMVEQVQYYGYSYGDRYRSHRRWQAENYRANRDIIERRRALNRRAQWEQRTYGRISRRTWRELHDYP